MKKPKANFPKEKPPEIISQTKIYDGMTVFENDSIIIKITDLELDYTGCYYESDWPSISGNLTTFKK